MRRWIVCSACGGDRRIWVSGGYITCLGCNGEGGRFPPDDGQRLDSKSLAVNVAALIAGGYTWVKLQDGWAGLIVGVVISLLGSTKVGWLIIRAAWSLVALGILYVMYATWGHW